MQRRTFRRLRDLVRLTGLSREDVLDRLADYVFEGMDDERIAKIMAGSKDAEGVPLAYQRLEPGQTMRIGCCNRHAAAMKRGQIYSFGNRMSRKFSIKVINDTELSITRVDGVDARKRPDTLTQRAPVGESNADAVARINAMYDDDNDDRDSIKFF